mmetsp:Transcript_2573/g.3952  ORF Transcript_2573/g.3952 Transcript_2573/m.3952 type:complete len:123 (+) Transcript_2573:1817-2185(+)
MAEDWISKAIGYDAVMDRQKTGHECVVIGCSLGRKSRHETLDMNAARCNGMQYGSGVPIEVVMSKAVKRNENNELCTRRLIAFRRNGNCNGESGTQYDQDQKTEEYNPSRISPYRIRRLDAL